MDLVKTINLGQRQVLFYPDDGSNVIDFGRTMDGVTVSVPTDTIDRTTHETGTTPYAINQTGIAALNITATFLMQHFKQYRHYLTSAKITSGGTPVASTTLDGQLAQGATTIILTAITGFEDVPEEGFVVKVEDEEIWVGYVDVATKTLGSATCPVERGYNNTDDVLHADLTAIDRLTTVIDLDPRPKKLPTGKLVLQPLGATSESNNDYVFYKTSIVGSISTVLGVSADEGFALTFRALLDTNCAGGMRIMRKGKDSVVPDEYF